MSKVYACFCTDIIHEGHLNILKEANKYGDVIVGILSDRAMIKYNRFPTISIVLQLIAYYVSLDKGLDVDKPRNLAKVVTVE